MDRGQYLLTALRFTLYALRFTLGTLPLCQQLFNVGHVFAVVVGEPAGDISGAGWVYFFGAWVVNGRHPRVIIVRHIAQPGGDAIVGLLHLVEGGLALTRAQLRV